MNQTKMKVNQQRLPSLSFGTEYGPSFHYPHARRVRLLAGTDADCNTNGPETACPASSQVATWATPHTNGCLQAIHYRPRKPTGICFHLTYNKLSYLPSDPHYLPPDAIVFFDRCPGISTGGGFIGESSRWRPSKFTHLSRKSLDAIREGALSSSPFSCLGVTDTGSGTRSLGCRCGERPATRAFSAYVACCEREEARPDDLPI